MNRRSFISSIVAALALAFSSPVAFTMVMKPKIESDSEMTFGFGYGDRRAVIIVTESI